MGANSLNCTGCGARPGELHRRGCEIECCPECGLSLITHQCALTTPRIRWSGEQTGTAECRAFGWYTRLVLGKGWVRCEKHESGARPDLQRLHVEAVWDKRAARFRIPRPPLHFPISLWPQRETR